MHYGEIKNCDIANGRGVRISLFVSGCRNHCPNCFNQVTWDFNYGKEYTAETEAKILKMLEPTYIQGLTILGGEPMEIENQPGVLELIKKVKETYPSKSIWIYTGFTLDELYDPKCRACSPYVTEILKYLDCLVDGRFVEALKDITLHFRGSSNQRLINVQETLKQKKIVEYDY